MKWLFMASANPQIASGKATGFYMQTECQGTHKGIVAAHCKQFCKVQFANVLTKKAYHNTTIVLETADQKWGLRPTRIIRASADNATTSDAGKTWVWQEIRLEQSVAPNDYKPNQ